MEENRRPVRPTDHDENNRRWHYRTAVVAALRFVEEREYVS
jgi:hypothetical protein